MIRFIGNRVLQAIPLVIGVSVIGFALMHLAPGGPLAVYTLNPGIGGQDIERLKVIFGLDQPVHVQYWRWATHMLVGDWGHTFFGGRPVLEVILERLPATLLLMGSALAVAILLGLSIGILGGDAAAFGVRHAGDGRGAVRAVIPDVLVRADGDLCVRGEHAAVAQRGNA